MQTTASVPATPGARLMHVARVLRDRPVLRVAAALVIPVGLSLGLRMVSSFWLLLLWPTSLAILLVIAVVKRSAFAWVAGYLLTAEIWTLLWIVAGHTSMPLQVDYAVAGDRLLGFGRLPSEWLQDLFYAGSVRPLEVTLLAVYTSFFFAHQATLFSLAFVRRGLLGPFVLAFVVATYLSLIVQFLAPTAPPWMAADLGAAPNLVRIGQETLRVIAGSAVVDGAYDSNINEVAAMPSVHIAATVVIAIAWARAIRGLRWVALAYSIAMAFALVYFAEHYLIDTIAGAGVALVGWRVADLVFARFPRLATGSETPEAEPDLEVERPLAA
ncbi:MAG: phosphatase PAP2 family protein [Dehalococcoidia bacterium]